MGSNPIEVRCKVEIPENLAVGDFANGIRILKDVGDDYLIDFCVFSPHAGKAVVVARIRVKSSFLDVILQRIASAKSEGTSPSVLADIEFEGTQAVLPDGRLLIFNAGDDREN